MTYYSIAIASFLFTIAVYEFSKSFNKDYRNIAIMNFVLTSFLACTYLL